MFNWLKIQTIRAQDLAHSVWDVTKNGKIVPFAISGMLSFYGALGAGLLCFSDDDRSTFSQELEALRIQDGGFGLDLPGDCDIDGRYYVTRTNKKGANGLELLREDSQQSYAGVLSNEEQKYTAELISNCFDEMALRLDNEADIDAVESLSYTPVAMYSDVALLHDIEDGEQSLAVDLIGDDFLSLEERVENQDGYDEMAEDKNIALYRAEFNLVQKNWDRAAKQIEKKSDADLYHDSDGAILKADQYARYDYDSFTLGEFSKSMGVAFPLTFIFICGVGTFNSSSFAGRRAERKEQIAYLQRSKGGGPIL